MPSRPRHRHATPSGPWPFLDVGDEIDPERLNDPYSHVPMSASPCIHEKFKADDVCWCKYPQALFPNWTLSQQKKSKIVKVIEKTTGTCTVNCVDVLEDGTFVSRSSQEVRESTVDAYWGTIQRGRPEGVRCRALFVDHLSGPVLQMLGTRYNIEPFYFSSSLGWIPSRYQSNIVDEVGDHITITLTFIRPVKIQTAPSVPQSIRSVSSTSEREKPMIDTQAPLKLESKDLLLVPDLLALHMVRSNQGNTIISYHPSHDHRATTAQELHERFTLTGHSVYWSTMFQQTEEPTLLFLSLLWYALYCWDEALEALSSHIGSLESQVMVTSEDMVLTLELHEIRAHLLYYESLLHDFRKTVTFVEHASYPGLDDSARYPPDLKETSRRLLETECENLLREIDRLENSKAQQEWRLRNVMNLAFSMVNIEDSKSTQSLTATGIRDSTAVRQIHYLFMIFLPGAFVAEAFKMNVTQLTGKTDNPGLHFYVVTAIPLTVLTIWLIIAYQFQIKIPGVNFSKRNNENNARSEFMDRRDIVYDRADSGEVRGWLKLCWPVLVVWYLWEKIKLWRGQSRRR